MNPAHALLFAHGLTVRAGGAALLDGVGVQLQPGEVLAVVGPNGAGKSTLLQTLAGLRLADAGEVLLQGKPLMAYSAGTRASLMAYLEQRPSVHWPLKVRQVVGFGRLPYGDLESTRAQQAIDAALASTDTAALQTRNFHTLSEGEKMRVHLARALAGAPRILLADEPIAALDPWHQLQVLELLRAEAARGIGVMLVLHDLGLAARFCDRVLLLDRGRVVSCGSPREVLTRGTLAAIWHIDATFDSDTLSLRIHGRLSASAQGASAWQAALYEQ
jgi:iron complex transport system ATP-binding protein